MDITKSTRHSKILGAAGEAIICNWLSRSGFETAFIDHTGIDIIAYNAKTRERLGISVKSRTRNKGEEYRPVTVFSKTDEIKVLAACKSFGCEPWIGIFIDTHIKSYIFICSLAHYKLNYRKTRKKNGFHLE